MGYENIEILLIHNLWLKIRQSTRDFRGFNRNLILMREKALQTNVCKAFLWFYTEGCLI
jgi:hypothetical protein